MAFGCRYEALQNQIECVKIAPLGLDYERLQEHVEATATLPLADDDLAENLLGEFAQPVPSVDALRIAHLALLRRSQICEGIRVHSKARPKLE